MTASRTYDVYGTARSANGTPSSKHAFVGQLGHPSDDGTGGLIYMRARWMDPQVGRFVSEDPAKHGNNWCQYCQGDPVNQVDADGKYSRFWSEIAAFLGCLLGAAGMYAMIMAWMAPVFSAFALNGIIGYLIAITPGVSLGAAGVGCAIVAVSVVCIVILAIAIGAIIAWVTGIAIAMAYDGIDNSTSGLFTGPGVAGNDPENS